MEDGERVGGRYCGGEDGLGDGRQDRLVLGEERPTGRMEKADLRSWFF